MRILVKFVVFKEQKIMTMKSEKIVRYIRHEMVQECLQEKGSIKEMLK
jgi:hypothetical protein